MLTVLREEGLIGQRLSFPVRAVMAVRSGKQLEKLLKESGEKASLTVWQSSESDKTDAKELVSLIETIGRGKVFLDVPEELKKEVADILGQV